MCVSPGVIEHSLLFLRKIVAMYGDGSFLMNVQGSDIAVRLRLPIIIMMWYDREFGVISLKQIAEFGKEAFTEFNNLDLVKLANSFGAIGYTVKSVKEFSNCLKKAKKSKCIPVVIS